MLAEASKSAPSDWVIQPIESVCSRVTSGGTPSRRVPEYFERGKWDWIKTQELLDRWIDDTEEHITDEAIENSSSKVLPSNTVLIAMYGATVGQLGILRHPMTCNQACCAFIVDEKKADFQYLFYQLLSHREQLKSAAVGAAQQNLNAQVLKQFELPFPSLPEQRAIAEILGALDDKIEVNRRMNATLESIARAVFREMMKDEGGNWKQGSILEFASLLSGGTPSTTEESYWNGDIEWVSAKDVGNVDSIFLLDTEKKITQQGVDNSSTKLLPERTTIITARGTVGAHCMLGKAMTMNQTNYGLKAKEGIGNYFVYFTLSEMVEQLKQQSYGTIFDTITTKTFQSAQCVQPPHDVIQKFESQVTPLLDEILNNQEQSRTLVSLRDSLLPKLMRGEVRVSEL